MSIDDKLSRKEWSLMQTTEFINSLERYGIDEKYIDKWRKQKKLLEESIEHDRKVQIVESQTSGRKKWWENAWKYAIVAIGAIVIREIVVFILNKF